jgi:hypothetical protein
MLGDAGGLHFKIAPVSLPGDREAATDLHTLWDGLLGADATAPAVIRLAEEAKVTYPEEYAEDTNEAEWVAESFEYAKMAAYAPLLKMTGTPRVSPLYLDEAREVSLQRVKLAGRRLALVIRQSLASYTPATPEQPDSSRGGAALKSSAGGDPSPAAAATSGVFKRPVGLTPAEVAPLKGSAEAVASRKEALRAELARLERVGAAAAMKKSLLDSLGGARLEVVKLHSRFERAGVEYKQAARLFFGGITARYDREIASVKQSRPRDFEAARDRAFLVLDFNHSAYETAAKKRSLTFDLEVSSKPEGVTISYKRSGDPAYTSDGSQTEVTLNNLVLAQWYVRAELKGYKPQEKVFDPFREQKYVLKFEMEAEPPPPPPAPPKATKGRVKGKGKGGRARRPIRRGR